MNKTLLQTVADRAPNRRRMLQTLGVATATAAIQAPLSAQTEVTDVDIVQFALNLEYLEAEFYTVGITGNTLAQMGMSLEGSGTSGETTGGRPVVFTDTTYPLRRILDEIGSDERAHVTFLRQTLASLGVQPIAKPAINLNALGAGFGSQAEFLAVARSLEDIGVTAYAGAAPLISDKTILGAAARILAAEAQHSGAIRLLVERLGVATTNLDALDVLPAPSGMRFIPVDRQGLSAVRTPGQALNLALGGKADVTMGGFFPNGLNGAIRTSSLPGACTV